jgi:quinolinate synthase
MLKHVRERRPEKVAMITECSMSDNLAAQFPEVSFVRPCNLCPHMKRITLPKIYEALRDLKFEIEIDPVTAGRARLAVERMLAVRATSAR